MKAAEALLANTADELQILKLEEVEFKAKLEATQTTQHALAGLVRAEQHSRGVDCCRTQPTFGLLHQVQQGASATPVRPSVAKGLLTVLIPGKASQISADAIAQLDPPSFAALWDVRHCMLCMKSFTLHKRELGHAPLAVVLF